MSNVHTITEFQNTAINELEKAYQNLSKYRQALKDEKDVSEVRKNLYFDEKKKNIQLTNKITELEAVANKFDPNAVQLLKKKYLTDITKTTKDGLSKLYDEEKAKLDKEFEEFMKSQK